MKQFKHINQVLGVDHLESIQGTTSLNLEQIGQIENALKPKKSNSQNIDQLQTAAARIKAETMAIKNDTALFRTAIDSISPLVAAQESTAKKVEAVRAMLAAKPGMNLNESLSDKELTTLEELMVSKDLQQVNWDAIDKLEHNKEADQKN